LAFGERKYFLKEELVMRVKALNITYSKYSSMNENKCSYLLRIVVPLRDFKVIEPILDELDEKGYTPLYKFRIKHFDNRRDLDSLEYIYVLNITSREARDLEKKLSKMLHGTIGFFLLFKLRK